MRGVDAIAEILKREGVEFICCYPANPLIEACAVAGIRPIVCRQERVGISMADGFTRVSNGKRTGVFVSQYGPGAENAFPGVAQAYADSVPILLLPGGYTQDRDRVSPNFSSLESYASVTKWVGRVNSPQGIPEMMRRAFSLLRSGRPGPVMLEVPRDVAVDEVGDSALDYVPVKATRSAGDPGDIAEAARLLLAARRPVIHAGQGVLYAEATEELLDLAELLQAPVMTTLPGKSGFPEDHPLSLGTGSSSTTKAVHHFLQEADVVFGIGCSLTRTNFGVTIPSGKTIIHSTTNAADINKDYRADQAIIGDAKLVLVSLLQELRAQAGPSRRAANGSVVEEIKSVKEAWLQEWMPKLTSNEVPLNPYRVIWDMMHTIDRRNAIVTHDSGSPRDQMVPFFETLAPRSYTGWGKSTQLGYGLGLAMGAKLAAPEKLAINVMGDAAFGMVGLDFETAVRSKIPILTIVLNNSEMGIEAPTLPVATERYGTLYLSGNYSEVAKALGGYSERIEQPGDIIPAIQRGVKTVQDGQAALLEFITCEEISYSKFPVPTR